MITKNEFLQRADEAFAEWVPAVFNLYYRQQIELDRTHYKQQARHADVDNFIYELMKMDVVFARLSFKRMSSEIDNAVLCLLLVARYTFSRERIASRKWRDLDIGGAGDREMNQACLFHLLDINSKAVKYAAPAGFIQSTQCAGAAGLVQTEYHAAIT